MEIGMTFGTVVHIINFWQTKKNSKPIFRGNYFGIGHDNLKS